MKLLVLSGIRIKFFFLFFLLKDDAEAATTVGQEDKGSNSRSNLNVV